MAMRWPIMPPMGQADDMGAALAQVVEQVHGVLRHVGQRVGRHDHARVGPGREQGLQGRRAGIRSVGEAGVAVVEHHRAQAGGHHAVDERIRPLDELAAQAVG